MDEIVTTIFLHEFSSMRLTLMKEEAFVIDGSIFEKFK
jgi:hypothetical protein